MAKTRFEFLQIQLLLLDVFFRERRGSAKERNRWVCCGMIGRINTLAAIGGHQLYVHDVVDVIAKIGAMSIAVGYVCTAAMAACGPGKPGDRRVEIAELIFIAANSFLIVNRVTWQ